MFFSRAGAQMPETKLEKPVVETASSGVSRVAPADILRSRVGQEEIGKAAAAAIALKLRDAQPSSKTVAPNGR
jgi:hypothetical protein